MQRTSIRRHDFAEALLGPLERRWGRITKEYDGTHPMPLGPLQGCVQGRNPLVTIPDAAMAAAPPAPNTGLQPPTVKVRAHPENLADRREDSSILHSGLVGT